MNLIHKIRRLWQKELYRIYQTSDDKILCKVLRNELKKENKYIRSPFSAKYYGTRTIINSSDIKWITQDILKEDPKFWKGKKILDLGCGHDSCVKTLLEICDTDFKYVGIDTNVLPYKYNKEKISFYSKKDINSLTIKDFSQEFDILLYLGVDILNLQVTKDYLKPKSYLIYGVSDYCWDKETNEKIIKQSFTLKQQIWSVIEFKVPNRNYGGPKSFEAINGYLIYQKNSFF